MKNSEEKVLILCADNRWLLPGGRMEEGESWLEGLKREIKEETGVTDFTVIRPVDTAISDSKSTYIVTFLCSVEGSPEVVLSSEHTAYAWVGVSDLSKYEFWHESIQKRIQNVLTESATDENYEKKDAKRGVDYIGVNVVFICHDGEGNILLHKRGPGCRDEVGVWDCGGGAVEFGESLEEAVRREVIEEYCVEAKEVEFLWIREAIREKDGRKTHWVPTVWYVLVDRSQVKNGEPNKLEELGWFRLNEMPQPLHSQFPYDLEMLRKHLGTK